VAQTSVCAHRPGANRQTTRSSRRTNPISSPGGIIEQSCGASAPHRVTDEVTLLRAIPASLCRGNQRPERSALPFERQQLSPLAGFEPAPVERSNPCLHHSANPCGGNQRLRFLSDALPLSYSNFRHRWESNPQLSDPDVTQAFTTPQTLESFSFPPYFVAAFVRLPRTHIASRCVANFPLPLSASETSGRNQRSRAFGIRTRAFRLFRRSNRELRHPGTSHLKRNLYVTMIYAGPAS
jgi:hypothetical protein